MSQVGQNHAGAIVERSEEHSSGSYLPWSRYRKRDNTDDHNKVSKLTRQDSGIVRACKAMGALLMFAFWQQFYAYFSGDPFGAYVSANMRCDQPNPPCPTGSFFVNSTAGGSCQAQDKFHPDWSLSPYCMDKRKVLAETAHINGWNGWIAAFFGLFAVFVSGQMIDTIGRRPVLIGFLSSNVIVKALLFASCFMQPAGFTAILFIQNIIEVAFSAGVEPALNSMVADVSKGNEQLRADGFAALQIIMHASDVLAFFAGYPVLKAHMTQYEYFWGPLIVASLIAWILFSFIPCTRLRETLQSNPVPKGQASQFSMTTCFHKVFGEAIAGFHMVRKDCFLLQIVFLWALFGIALNGSWGLGQVYLQDLGYEQANASLARPFWHLAMVIGSFLCLYSMRWFGVRGSFAGSIIMITVGFTMAGFGSPYPEKAEISFWIGVVALGGIGSGIMAPSFNSIISSRVNEKDLGKLFSFVIVANTLCGLAFGQFWPQLFFDPYAVGWKKGALWWSSAAAFVLTFIWFMLLCLFSRREPKKLPQEAADEPSSSETDCPSTEDAGQFELDESS